jgi:hypothetical protein
LGPAKVVIKPWHERMDEVQVRTSSMNLTGHLTVIYPHSFLNQTQTTRCASFFLLLAITRLTRAPQNPTHPIHLLRQAPRAPPQVRPRRTHPRVCAPLPQRGQRGL